MIPFNPSKLWAITEAGMRMIESGFFEAVARAAAGRAREDQPKIVTQIGDTAVIDIMGPMLKRENIWTQYGYATSTQAVTAAINAAVADEKVRSIVLNIDTPGGVVDGMHAFVASIDKAKKLKPVIAQVDGMAASAGYWAASKATAIYAGPGDEIGSIGVRMMLYDFSRAFAAAGIEAIPVDTGEFKSAGAMGTKITDAQREDFQRQVDNYFADFYGDVKRGRKLTEAQAQAVGDGRMFMAREALENGLIDGVQSMEQTLRVARRMTGKGTDTAKARARWRDLMSA